MLREHGFVQHPQYAEICRRLGYWHILSDPLRMERTLQQFEEAARVQASTLGAGSMDFAQSCLEAPQPSTTL